MLGLSVVAALYSVATQRVVAKKRAAYDYMIQVRQSPAYIKAHEAFMELSLAGNMEKVVDPQTARDREEKDLVRNYLNSLELLCVSIEFHIVDEMVCKAQLGDIIVQRWKDAKPFVDGAREKAGGDDEIYEYFQRVATRWENDPAVHHPNVIIRAARELISI